MFNTNIQKAHHSTEIDSVPFKDKYPSFSIALKKLEVEYEQYGEAWDSLVILTGTNDQEIIAIIDKSIINQLKENKKYKIWHEIPHRGSIRILSIEEI